MTENYMSISLDAKACECICVAGELKLRSLLNAMTERKLTFSSAESCTGGLVGKLITDLSGSSAIYAGGAITYTNEIKINVLGVNPETINEHTEVSRRTACEMALRVREKFGTDIGVATTGYAGPAGGTRENPKGTVYVAVSDGEVTKIVRVSYFDEATRSEIRTTSAYLCYEIVERMLKNK